MTAPRHYVRRNPGTAWHMSRVAVSASLPEVLKWSKDECLDAMVEARFGSWETVVCPHCGTISRHYWRVLESRWKCHGCDKTFSITSGTVFSSCKLSLQELAASVLLWVNSAAGQPALELKRHMNKAYNTVYVLQHKMREGMVRGYNVGLVCGDVEMDGAHQSGKRSVEKRGKPQLTPSLDDKPLTSGEREKLLTQVGQIKAKRREPKGQINPEFGWRMPKDRRILMAVRKRSGTRGKGAVASRVAIGLSETMEVAEAVLQSFVAVPESCLNTDTSPAYTDLGRRFRVHRTVEHAKMLVGPNGENNNQVEELNGRMDRAERGIYLNIEPKYLLDYAAETAFRSDTRRLPNGEQLKLALNVAMSVGLSLFWQGFTHGRHRSVELLHPAPRPAPSSGPRKGRSPISSANGRPPR